MTNVRIIKDIELYELSLGTVSWPDNQPGFIILNEGDGHEVHAAAKVE